MTTSDLDGLVTELNRVYLMYIFDKNIVNEQLLQKAAENLDRALSHDIQEQMK